MGDPSHNEPSLVDGKHYGRSVMSGWFVPTDLSFSHDGVITPSIWPSTVVHRHNTNVSFIPERSRIGMDRQLLGLTSWWFHNQLGGGFIVLLDSGFLYILQ